MIRKGALRKVTLGKVALGKVALKKTIAGIAFFVGFLGLFSVFPSTASAECSAEWIVSPPASYYPNRRFWVAARSDVGLNQAQFVVDGSGANSGVAIGLDAPFNNVEHLYWGAYINTGGSGAHTIALRIGGPGGEICSTRTSYTNGSLPTPPSTGPVLLYPMSEDNNVYPQGTQQFKGIVGGTNANNEHTVGYVHSEKSGEGVDYPINRINSTPTSGTGFPQPIGQKFYPAEGYMGALNSSTALYQVTRVDFTQLYSGSANPYGSYGEPVARVKLMAGNEELQKIDGIVLCSESDSRCSGDAYQGTYYGSNYFSGGPSGPFYTQLTLYFNPDKFFPATTQYRVELQAVRQGSHQANIMGPVNVRYVPEGNHIGPDVYPVAGGEILPGETNPQDPWQFAETDFAHMDVWGNKVDSSCTGSSISFTPTTLYADQTATVTIQMPNNGTNTWSAGSNYQVYSVSGSTWDISGTPLNLSASTAPGGTGIFSGTVTAPSTAGTYTINWKIKHIPSDAFLGPQCTSGTSIVVSNQTPPAVNNIDVKLASSDQTTFGGDKSISGKIAPNGSNWINPMKVTLAATKGTNDIKMYYAAFYIKDASHSQLTNASTFVTDITTRLSDPNQGFVVRYDKLTGKYETWDKTRWYEVPDVSDTTGKVVKNSNDNTMYQVWSAGTGVNGYPRWQVRLADDFSSKVMYTAGYVEDNLPSPLKALDNCIITSESNPIHCKVLTP